ncbi:methyltransferase [Iamia sp. SCSIO 61187]|uniref:methyltransferase n=1 Tax=Iamia sp. SCSIO 61187 TaxID=2722752 RepID=UPI00210255BA|nr:methyltransferase [Iamia sp. SCSIO 61187]QYG95691.1 methyltransferase [Iamia sp. SCSIO 61187]
MAVPQGTFALERPDAGERSPLRAWDAADEMVLRHLDAVGATGEVVLVGDAWGALACALAPTGPTVVVDSYVAGRAIGHNLAAHGLLASSVRVVTPLADLPERVDVAVVKVPKTTALLEHVLHRLAPSLHGGSIVVGAGMARHVHSSTIDLFERLVGPTRTSRAEKKARLIHAQVAGRVVGPSPWPREVVVTPPGGEPLTAVAHAGVFSADHLDPGTALLLAHLPEPGVHRAAVDLGCGTGVVGTVLARRDPDLEVTFVDDSTLAVASARATWAGALGDRTARFTVGDALEDLADGEPVTPDLVVVNPPFHRDHTVGDATAWRMFAQARAVLAPGGELLVVGNRHLAYHAKLKRLFGTAAVEVVGSDPGFVVLRAATSPR